MSPAVVCLASGGGRLYWGGNAEAATSSQVEKDPLQGPRGL